MRGFQHDVKGKVKLPIREGLVLCRKTMAHLDNMPGSQGYLMTRCCPLVAASISPIKTLMAGLEEAGRKVTVTIPFQK